MQDAMCRRFFFFQAEDGIRDVAVTGVQTCALPIYFSCESVYCSVFVCSEVLMTSGGTSFAGGSCEAVSDARSRSEEHTSELQSRLHLVCRLLLEKKNKTLYERPFFAL